MIVGYPQFESLSLRHVFNNLETLAAHSQSINGELLYSHPRYLPIRLRIASGIELPHRFIVVFDVSVRSC